MGRLQTARLENFIRRWGSIKGPGSVLSETLGDVFPVLDLENLTPENQLTAGWSTFYVGGNVTGVATKLGALQLVNPVGSGNLVVLDRFIAQTNVSQTMAGGVNNTPLTTVISSTNRDTRQSSNFQGGAVLAASTDATGGLGDFIFRVPTNIDREIAVEGGIAVLAPGAVFQITASTVATLIRAVFFGRLRLAEPSELSF